MLVSVLNASANGWIPIFVYSRFESSIRCRKPKVAPKPLMKALVRVNSTGFSLSLASDARVRLPSGNAS